MILEDLSIIGGTVFVAVEALPEPVDQVYSYDFDFGPCEDMHQIIIELPSVPDLSSKVKISNIRGSFKDCELIILAKSNLLVTSDLRIFSRVLLTDSSFKFRDFFSDQRSIESESIILMSDIILDKKTKNFEISVNDTKVKNLFIISSNVNIINTDILGDFYVKSEEMGFVKINSSNIDGNVFIKSKVLQLNVVKFSGVSKIYDFKDLESIDIQGKVEFLCSMKEKEFYKILFKREVKLCSDLSIAEGQVQFARGSKVIYERESNSRLLAVTFEFDASEGYRNIHFPFKIQADKILFKGFERIFIKTKYIKSRLLFIESNDQRNCLFDFDASFLSVETLKINSKESYITLKGSSSDRGFTIGKILIQGSSRLNLANPSNISNTYSIGEIISNDILSLTIKLGGHIGKILMKLDVEDRLLNISTIAPNIEIAIENPESVLNIEKIISKLAKFKITSTGKMVSINTVIVNLTKIISDNPYLFLGLRENIGRFQIKNAVFGQIALIHDGDNISTKFLSHSQCFELLKNYDRPEQSTKILFIWKDELKFCLDGIVLDIKKDEHKRMLVDMARDAAFDFRAPSIPDIVQRFFDISYDTYGVERSVGSSLILDDSGISVISDYNPDSLQYLKTVLKSRSYQYPIDLQNNLFLAITSRPSGEDMPTSEVGSFIFLKTICEVFESITSIRDSVRNMAVILEKTYEDSESSSYRGAVVNITGSINIKILSIYFPGKYFYKFKQELSFKIIEDEDIFLSLDVSKFDDSDIYVSRINGKLKSKAFVGNELVFIYKDGKFIVEPIIKFADIISDKVPISEEEAKIMIRSSDIHEFDKLEILDIKKYYIYFSASKESTSHIYSFSDIGLNIISSKNSFSHFENADSFVPTIFYLDGRFYIISDNKPEEISAKKDHNTIYILTDKFLDKVYFSSKFIDLQST